MTGVRCYFDEMDECGTKSGKVGVVCMSPALWEQIV